METTGILVLGAGPAGLYAAQEAAKRGAKVTLAGAEKYPPYWRPRLSKMLAHPLPPEEIAIRPAGWFEKNGVAWLPQKEAVAVLPAEAKAVFRDGSVLTYRRLIIAAGAHSHVPTLEGARSLFTLRGYDDVQPLREAALRARRAVVLGGGLLGLEIAWSLMESGVSVTVAVRGTALLNRQLPQAGGDFVADYFRRHGVALFFQTESNDMRAILRDACVVVAAGVRSNTGFLKDSGLQLDRGVVVDAGMRTNLPGVFACGDVAQFQGKIPGLIPVATEQGRIAGINATGGSAAYEETPPSPMLNVGGLRVFSTGENGAGDILYERADDVFQSVAIMDGKLAGGVLIGDLSKTARLKNAVAQKRDVSRAKTLSDVMDAV